MLSPDSWQWSKPKLKGTHPPPLRAHSATYIPVVPARSPLAPSGYILVFGGGDGPTYFNDLYLLNLFTYTWSKPTEIYGTVPSPRRAHTAVWREEKQELIVFGGGNGAKALNETYVLQCVAGQKDEELKWNWKKLETKGQKPRLRGYRKSR